MRRWRIPLSVAFGVAILAGLYLLNRYWIAPASLQKKECATARPMAADFTLTSLNGKQINLKKYRGKVVLLNFWATWCGPCRMEIPGLKKLQREFGPKGLRVIGMDVISEDNPSAVRAFYKQYKMNYPVVLANDNVGNLYGGLWATPTTILIGCDGRVYRKYVGYRNTSVLGHAISGLLASCTNGGPSPQAYGMLIARFPLWQQAPW